MRKSARWAHKARAPRPPVGELDRFEVWRTPGHVVEQGLWAGRLLAGVEADRIADLGAGSGPFGQRCKRVYKGAHRLGVEIRDSERPNLRRNYDQHIIGDMFGATERLRRYAPRLVVSNPPYSYAFAALLLALSIVAVGGHVLFFVRSTFGSAADVWSFLREHPPVAEFSVAGRPNMREGVSESGAKFGGDFVPHTWLLFRRGRRARGPSACVRYWLPPLMAEDLTWTVIPGSERSAPAFPPIYMPEVYRDAQAS